MKVLVVGGGGREHAIVWKVSLSPKVKKIYCAPGNPGSGQLAENVNIQPDDIQGLSDFALKQGVDLTVVGPELPLTLGIVDEFESKGLLVFGPNKSAAELEGSKVFSKKFMERQGIPSAKYGVFESVAEARDYMRNISVPVVVKADGLAAGKGVLICKDKSEALEAIDTILVDNKFGNAGSRIIIEEFLEGDEVSFMAITDGEICLPLISARDHKQIFDGNKGPNTGGMGAFAPTPIVTEEIHKKIIENVLRPTIAGMASEGRVYKGLLYAGLMICNGEPLVLEFNCRFGDPETQPVMMMMKGDLVPVMEKSASGSLKGATLDWHDGVSVCVVMAAGGYPGTYEKGIPINGLQDLPKQNDGMVFHAGTALNGDKLVTNGGRVLGVTQFGPDLETAVNKAYDTTRQIQWEGVQFRRDIGRN